MKALLIIDIQNDYFEGGKNPLKNSLQASELAKNILEKFRDEKLPVIHIQHVSSRPDATFFIPQTSGVEIHSHVKPKEGEIVIIKNFPNSFIKTNLQDTLKKLKVDELVICGMMTHMCVDATTRAARDLGYTCTLIADACATCDLEINGEKIQAKEVQNSFLAALSYYYANVQASEQFLSSKV
ncbi:MAG: cysteine hydrolase [Apibacter sp.]|jgi:nicotinamidase-related amidase|nr:cysteine hydrolase [Apibacter sp.]